MKKTQDVPDIYSFEVTDTSTRLKEFKSADLPLYFADTEKYSTFTIYYKASIKNGRLHLENIHHHSFEGANTWSYGSGANMEDVFHDRCVSVEEASWTMAVDKLKSYIS